MSTQENHELPLKGNIRHSVCRWCYSKLELNELCREAKRIGIESIDLLTLEDARILSEYGLTCALITGVPGDIEVGLNRVENHDAIIEWFEKTIPIAAENGYRSIVCFSGNREGMSPEQGIENCAMGLKRITPLAEKFGITIVMELLNSKVDHPDYMCDNSAWGVELCKAVGSESFKLLYDVYHMQIMEGDVISTIKANSRFYGHYHTGGVPGRAEIDETQELYYPAIMRAILDTDYDGFVAQEFIPKNENAIESLEAAIEICDV